MAEDLQDQGAELWAERLGGAARLGILRDVLLRCLRALREADDTGAGLNLVERLLHLVEREGRSLH